MKGKVNGLQGSPGQADGGSVLDAGSALNQVLAAVVAARTATGVAGPAASGSAPLTGVQVLAALGLLRELRTQIAGWEPELIDAARHLGTSWADLAPALGVASRQAAERRFLRLRPSDTPGTATTGEQRVTAERGRRAGDRAARAWARDNAAGLRQLAGQITALTDLPDGAAHDMAAVRQALGADDAADLLGPLGQVRTHLEAGHPGLAEAIADVDQHSGQARHDAHRRSAD